MSETVAAFQPAVGAASAPGRDLRLGLALRFALREMRGGLSGFWIFVACIAIGVAAIGGVNSPALAMSAGGAALGRDLLGADMRFDFNQREATPAELDYLAGLGTVSTSAGMRSMARLADGSDQALVEVKAVDALYPLYRTLVTEPLLPADALFAETDGAWGAAAPPAAPRAGRGRASPGRGGGLS